MERKQNGLGEFLVGADCDSFRASIATVLNTVLKSCELEKIKQ